MCCWENFTSGDLALWQRFQFHPGDFRSCLLESYTLSFEGERSSIIFFSGDGVTIIIIHIILPVGVQYTMQNLASSDHVLS